MKTYHVITFGCQMNERDSETIAGMLEDMGYVYTEDPKSADAVVLNTCSVRENADKRFFGVLGQLKNPHEARPGMMVCVCGCMMQQQHIIDQLKAKYSWVDLAFGTHNLASFPELFKNASSEKKHIIDIWQEGRAISEGLPAARAYDFKAYVNIMQGCNNFCSYCIVPYTRGRERSRRPEAVLSELRQLAASGCKEVMLLGQNVNSYGRARSVEGSYCAETDEPHLDFAGLLREADKIEGIERIRFMTSHPKDLSDDLIDCFRDLKHLCRQIHLPVQSGSTKVLKEMNRVYDREKYLSLVRKLREACPEIAISTDIIVGFPGETEEDFQDTLSLVEEVRYDSAFTFIYSVRQGTPAAERKDQVPEEVKHERFNRLIDAIHRIQEEKAEQYRDAELYVLTEGFSRTDDTMLTGHTESGRVVDFPGDPSLIGKMVKVRITKPQTFSLYGEVIGQEA
ncbi:MAG: tRNA (N6-isopentenyl adenosine(37)-C2)-methylthiotransferase MiaB [Firmicutes bacterium]|nr:tRNA (N6-isopentenyl adenosine(37)-C2)-methylthiotransferase MiaB [Bacillota bacterium]